ncbi:MFS transporter [Pseudactinotalea sp. HY160]|uniref:MFS transporter n=1 Tax=Pseudactinotalea sp. HY160 TaxID=2654490 RepID=UPI00128E78F0|nr:MFS transporter [Pseudactinotalea sp. HY160]MPV51151.1 MFS transporter [Pseudactinotalea sp. HY160]
MGSRTQSATRPSSLVIAVLCFGSMAGALMQSLVIPIQSELPALLSTSASNASWVVTVTLLAGAIAMPVAGRLADMYGKKHVLVTSAAVLLVGSLITALSSTLAPVLVGRALQGAAMGYIPVAISLVREVAPPHLRTGAVAAVSATLGVGGALGLPLAAWIAQSYSWHGLFWVSAALAVLVLAFSWLLVPATGSARSGRLDGVGILGLSVGLAVLLVGVSKGSGWGWGSATTWGCIGGGLAVLLAWGVYELRRRSALVDLRTMALRPVLFTNTAAVLIGFGMMAQSIVVPQLLQAPEATGYGLGQSILAVGLWMAPGGLMMMAMAPVSSRMIRRYGARITLAVGAVVLSAGYFMALFLMGSPWQLMLATIVACSGVGIGYAAMPTLILDNVPAGEAGSGVGVNSLMRAIGTTTAGAVMAALLTSQLQELAPGGPSIPTSGAFQLCFLVGAVAALAGAAITLLVPREAGRRAVPGPGAEQELPIRKAGSPEPARS